MRVPASPDRRRNGYASQPRYGVCEATARYGGEVVRQWRISIATPSCKWSEVFHLGKPSWGSAESVRHWRWDAHLLALSGPLWPSGGRFLEPQGLGWGRPSRPSGGRTGPFSAIQWQPSAVGGLRRRRQAAVPGAIKAGGRARGGGALLIWGRISCLAGRQPYGRKGSGRAGGRRTLTSSF